jgi:hypothetical protein
MLSPIECLPQRIIDAHQRLSPVGRQAHGGEHPTAPAAHDSHDRSDRASGRTDGGTAQASPETPATAPRCIRRAVLVPRFGGDATADWYSTALPQLAGLGIRTKVVSLLPEPTAPGVNETVAAIAKAVGDNPHEIAQTPSLDTASAAGRCWHTSTGTGRIEHSLAWSPWPDGSRWTT